MLGYVLSMLGICVVMGLFAGLYAKFISVVLGTLAYPAYLALYGMEFVLAPGSKKGRQFFGFNMPKGGPARMACHFLGATTTIILIAPLGLRVFSAATDLKRQGLFWESAFNGTLFPAPLTVTAFQNKQNKGSE